MNPVEAEDRLAEQRERVTRAWQQHEAMKQALVEIRSLEVRFRQQLWGKGQHSGVRLSECSLNLEREITTAAELARKEESQLAWLQREIAK